MSLPDSCDDALPRAEIAVQFQPAQARVPVLLVEVHHEDGHGNAVPLLRATA